MNEGLLSIGEMSKMCNVSKRTLRYYDVIGLIKPAHAKKENGYRFYEPYQVGRVFLIKQMQELGISLEDVSNCVKEKGTEINIEEFFNQIIKREADIKEEMNTLIKQQDTIRDYISQYEKIKEQLNDAEKEVTIQFIGKRYLINKRFDGKLNEIMFGRTYAEIGSILQNYCKNKCDLLPQIGGCFSGERNKEGCINEIGFFIDRKIKLEPFELTEIAEGYYATYRYVGEYNQIDKQYEILRRYLLGLNYCLKDYCLEIYHLSANITLKESAYITELQIPIKPNI